MQLKHTGENQRNGITTQKKALESMQQYFSAEIVAVSNFTALRQNKENSDMISLYFFEHNTPNIRGKLVYELKHPFLVFSLFHSILSPAENIAKLVAT